MSKSRVASMLEESVLDGCILFENFEFRDDFGFFNFSRTSFFEKDFLDELNNLTRAEIFPIFSQFSFFCIRIESSQVIYSWLQMFLIKSPPDGALKMADYDRITNNSNWSFNRASCVLGMSRFQRQILSAWNPSSENLTFALKLLKFIPQKLHTYFAVDSDLYWTGTMDFWRFEAALRCQWPLELVQISLCTVLSSRTQLGLDGQRDKRPFWYLQR